MAKKKSLAQQLRSEAIDKLYKLGTNTKQLRQVVNFISRLPKEGE